MTEEEKIVSGHMFNNRCKELVEIKRRTHRLCREYNGLDETDPHREEIMRQITGRIGQIFYFQGPLQFNYGCHTYIGENFFANFNLVVMDDARVFIGDNVCIGPNVSLLATNHPLLRRNGWA
jgi:acetyltransferase-like isoleucine patch superfamily enzyme